jgi:hypothetical protein
MTKVVGYLAGIPAKNSNPTKPEILIRFIEGVNRVGDVGIVNPSTTLTDCDVAVIQGWTHEHGKQSAHLLFRQQVINQQRQLGRKLIVADSNLFNYKQKNHPKNYLRYSLDGVFPTTGCYFGDNPDPLRWQQISQDLGLSLRPWRTVGNHILLCTQRQGGWSMKGTKVLDWVNSTVNQIRKYSERPIVIRPHPGDNQAKKYMVGLPNISTKENLVDDFHNAWAVVTYNSTPGVAAAIEGIPVFVTDPTPKTSQAFAVANTDLSQIENPKTFERQAWIEQLAMSHWSFAELSNGTAWQHMKKFI